MVALAHQLRECYNAIPVCDDGLSVREEDHLRMWAVQLHDQKTGQTTPITIDSSPVRTASDIFSTDLHR